ncbi:uncharacterized protein LY79DRAFT_584824 [Colletotrichum navitas]|uniref:Uncharacterized protein n=1 Tax=Colletotrichum navitas TaxID=681940 RepID=A0AAD8PK90_9PEZI|nr:uncharacterized protein LY79DRAFT_584824 [Colletotrichum navitas]KAK1566386.1 hypothetical protein LY79DRAFT_584824 [Colletotrichum navitas]
MKPSNKRLVQQNLVTYYNIKNFKYFTLALYLLLLVKKIRPLMYYLIAKLLVKNLLIYIIIANKVDLIKAFNKVTYLLFNNFSIYKLTKVGSNKNNNNKVSSNR